MCVCIITPVVSRHLLLHRTPLRDACSYISLLHNYSPRPSVALCMSWGFVPWWAHPRSPSRARSLPAGELHGESLQWIRSTSAQPRAALLTHVCAPGHCVLWGCGTCVWLWVCPCVSYLDVKRWRPLTEGIPGVKCPFELGCESPPVRSLSSWPLTLYCSGRAICYWAVTVVTFKLMKLLILILPPPSPLVMSCYIDSLLDCTVVVFMKNLAFLRCCHVSHDFHRFGVHCLHQSNRQEASLLCLCGAIGRLSHPASLMHRVIFLPLTAPLAPADINWMRKQNARLYVAEVAAEHEALAATGWSVSPGQMGVGQFLVHKQNKWIRWSSSVSCGSPATTESYYITPKDDFLKPIWQAYRLFGKFPWSNIMKLKTPLTHRWVRSSYSAAL